MPTGTTLSGYSFTNNGPLTTTFTAPASCATAVQTAFGYVDEPVPIEWNADCNWLPPADCNPNGAVIQSLVSSADGSNPTAGDFVVYHSPGLVCPSGWVTVGAAAKSNPTSASVSGAFNLSAYLPTGTQESFFEPYLDIFLDLLDPGESAAVCCPSSNTPIDGACYSTLSNYTATTGCQRDLASNDVGSVLGTWTIGGDLVTGALLTVTAATPLSTRTTSIAPSDASSFVGVAVNDMFILVHQASDTAKGSTAPTTAPATVPTTAPTTTPTTSTKSNSAVRARTGKNKLGVVTGMYCLVMALEALLVV